MAVSLALGFPLHQCGPIKPRPFRVSGDGGGAGVFPSFLPEEVHKIRDPFARNLAQRIQRLPVQVGFSESCIMSSCVMPRIRTDASPVVLLHCFDSSCLEWRSAYPLLEDAGLEVWAIDILGWGFSDLETRPPCNVASKRYHLYQLWKSHIKRPMILVGPSLGAAVAIDFAVNFPEAVKELILINANVYTNGTGVLTKLPKSAAYAMASLLKSTPIRWYAKTLVFNGISLSSILDYTNVGRLHCLLPWWEDATVNFMLSGGYNVTGQIKRVKQRALLICSECDNIVDSRLAAFQNKFPALHILMCTVGNGDEHQPLPYLYKTESLKVELKLQNELPNATIRQVPECGHMPHIEKPYAIAKLIVDFAQAASCEEMLESVAFKN